MGKLEFQFSDDLGRLLYEGGFKEIRPKNALTIIVCTKIVVSSVIVSVLSDIRGAGVALEHNRDVFLVRGHNHLVGPEKTALIPLFGRPIG